MGIYDRDYYRQGRSGFRLSAPRSAVGAIILLNIAVFVVENVERMARAEPGESAKEFSHDSKIVSLLSTHVNVGRPKDDTLLRPWMWWQFLTSGFVHDLADIQHIFFNMLLLFMLGREVEQWYGTREFIRLYLVMLVFSSAAWAVSNRLLYPHQPSILYGASGAISGVVVLYALNFPRRILNFMFVLPLPAWLVGAIMIAYDVVGRDGARRSAHRLRGPPGRRGLRLAVLQLSLELRPTGSIVRHLAERPLAAFAQGFQARE